MSNQNQVKALSSEFDWGIYVQCNPSLEHLTTYEAAHEHWLKMGQGRGLVATEELFYQVYSFEPSDLPEDFDWQVYLQLNPDVYAKMNSKWKAIRHYLKHGKKEQRKYFAPESSLKNCVDLIDQNGCQAAIHTIDEGIASSFNWEIYTQCNCGTEQLENSEAAYAHCLEVGQAKNFVATEAQFYQVYGFKKSDLPDDFDWQLYLNLNSDVQAKLGDKKWLAIKHFLKYGMREGRTFFPGRPPAHRKLANQTKFLVDRENFLENPRFEIKNLAGQDASSKKPDLKQWDLTIHPSWEIEIDNPTPKASKYIDKQSYLGIKIRDAQSSNTSSFLRQTLSFERKKNIQSRLEASLELIIYDSNRPRLLLALFADNNLKEKIYQKSIPAGKPSEQTIATISIDLQKDLQHIKEVPLKLYAIFQINFPPTPNGEIHLINSSFTLFDKTEEWRPLHFYFSTFGDYSKASSRLRAWKLMNCLKEAGHYVSTNFNDNCDVYVYQKNRPLGEIRAIKNKNAIIVYDFDDNYALPTQGTQSELIAFMNSADVITVGSNFLKSFATKYHPNVFILENPADIITDTVKRQPSDHLRKIGWFGAPENLSQLNLVNINEPIITITKGGDIEFDIYTVDEVLIQFDILLFPLELSEWNLAKNANRMIKAVSLGIPILATATPEHVKVAHELGLDDNFLVQNSRDWNKKIDYLKANYKDVQNQIANARNKALEIYSIQRITENWFNRIVNSSKRVVSLARGPMSSYYRDGSFEEPCFREVAILRYNYESSSSDDLTLCGTEVNWKDFGNKYLISASEDKSLSTILKDFGFQQFYPHTDYLDIFQEIEDIFSRLEENWLLVASSKYVFLKGLYPDICCHISKEHPEPVVLFESHRFGTIPKAKPSSITDLVNALCYPFEPGVLLIQKDWLKSNLHLIRPAKLLNYWSWYLVLRALRESHLYKRSSNPIALHNASENILNLSIEYAKWLEPRDKHAKENLPDLQSQWRRITCDIITDIASDFPEFLSSVVSHSLSKLNLLTHENDKLKNESRTKI